jgi:hypothetical protein
MINRGVSRIGLLKFIPCSKLHISIKAPTPEQPKAYSMRLSLCEANSFNAEVKMEVGILKPNIGK